MTAQPPPAARPLARWVLLALLLFRPGLRLCAQVPDSTRQKAKGDSAAVQAKTQEILREAHVIRWYEAAAVVGGVALASTLDQPIQRSSQKHRAAFLGDIATIFRQQGEPWYYAGVSLGVYGTGLIAGSSDLRRAGRRLVVTVASAGVLTAVLKRAVGRSRPNENVGAFTFTPFTSLSDSLGVQQRGSFPSGHSMAAFAVATSLADDINHPVATVALFAVATGAAWSRIYDNRHWLSDTIFGAALGITTSKVTSGRWRVFGWRPPSILVRPTGDLAMGWDLDF